MRGFFVSALFLVSACSGKTGAAGEDGRSDGMPKARPVTAAAAAPLAATGFVPLRSAEVQAAIHRALRTRKAQRWQDGAYSGYAVPSIDTLANGCRTIRYTVDQQPEAPATTINACETSR